MGLPSIRNGVAVNPATIAPWSWKNFNISMTGSLHCMCASSTMTSENPLNLRYRFSPWREDSSVCFDATTTLAGQ